jgi:hypothetical protein
MNELLAYIMGAVVFALVVTLIRVIVGPAPTTTWGELVTTPPSRIGIERPRTRPDARQTDPVIGWRSWALRRSFSDSGHTTTWVLTSPTQEMVEWRPRVAMRATCQLSGGHDAPNRACSCGLYAVTHSGFIYPGFVVGEMKGWGRVIEHQLGWRAASAYPSSLSLVCHACRAQAQWARADWVVSGSRSLIETLAESYSVRAMMFREALLEIPLAICGRHWNVDPEEAVRNEHGVTVYSAADVTARLLADYAVEEAALPNVS